LRGWRREAFALRPVFSATARSRSRTAPPSTSAAFPLASNHPHKQFQLLVYESDGAEHHFTACSSLEACGSLDVVY
jgi:hypothetical protein